jgi:putative transcriptional regulator
VIRVQLDKALKRARISMFELARRTRIAQSTISRFNAQKTGRVSYETLDALCRELRCQPGDLLVWCDDSESSGKKTKPHLKR